MSLNKTKSSVAVDLATGVTQRRAAKRHGIHFMTITLWKRSPEFTREIKRLRRSFVAAVKEERL